MPLLATPPALLALLPRTGLATLAIPLLTALPTRLALFGKAGNSAAPASTAGRTTRTSWIVGNAGCIAGNAGNSATGNPMVARTTLLALLHVGNFAAYPIVGRTPGTVGNTFGNPTVARTTRTSCIDGSAALQFGNSIAHRTNPHFLGCDNRPNFGDGFATGGPASATLAHPPAVPPRPNPRAGEF